MKLVDIKRRRYQHENGAEIDEVSSIFDISCFEARKNSTCIGEFDNIKNIHTHRQIVLIHIMCSHDTLR